jgi:hypothetical protein
MKLFTKFTLVAVACGFMAVSVMADQAGCCKKAAAAGKKCTMKCCVAAAKQGKECEMCGGKGDIKKAAAADANAAKK